MATSNGSACPGRRNPGAGLTAVVPGLVCCVPRLTLLFVLFLVLACDDVRLATPAVSGPTRFRPARPVEIQFCSLVGPSESTAYVIDWGDAGGGETTAFCSVAEACAVSHTYSDSGDYEIRALAWDGKHSSGWSSGYPVEVRPFGPAVPRRPAGRDSVAAGDTARYITYCRHPLGEPVSYQFDWGDSLGGYGPFVSPDSVFSAPHSWGLPGAFAVRARSRDTTGAESAWSDAIEVIVTGGLPRRALYTRPR